MPLSKQSSKSRPIYLDYHSTTPVDRRVADHIYHYMTIASKRDRFQTLLLNRIPGLVINGDTTSRLAGNLHISIPDIPNSAVIARVRSKLAISTGSACSSGIETPSHVLRALGLSDTVIEGALRIGLGKFTTDAEIDQAAEILSTAVSQTLHAICL